MLAQHIDRITVGPVATRGSHTFDPSTVSITWRTPVGGERAADPTRLVGPRIQLEFRGRASADQPAPGNKQPMSERWSLEFSPPQSGRQHAPDRPLSPDPPAVVAHVSRA